MGLFPGGAFSAPGEPSHPGQGPPSHAFGLDLAAPVGQEFVHEGPLAGHEPGHELLRVGDAVAD